MEKDLNALAVDVQGAARLLSVSVKTVRREIESGNLPALRIGRYWRIRVAAIESYLRHLEMRGRVTEGAQSE